MSDPYVIRRYNESDVEEIVELLKIGFPDWRNNRSAVDYWHWKYASSPLGSLVYVASYDDEIIGVSHSILLRMKLGDTECLGVYGDDATTHPSHQRKGVWGMINKFENEDYKNRGINFMYSIPISPAFTRKRKPGQVFLSHKVNHYFKVYDPEAFVKSKNLETPFTAASIRALMGLSNTRSKIFPTKKNDDLVIVESKVFTKEIESLMTTLDGYIVFGVVRSFEYLNWRYCDPRGGRFYLYQVFEGETQVGYAVCEVRGEGGELEGYLLDLSSMPKRPDVVDALICAALNKFEELGVYSVNYRSVEGYPTLGRLSKFGFMRVPSQKDLLVKINLKNLPESIFDVVNISSPDKIRLEYGDYF